MGIAQAGIAFKSNLKGKDLQNLIETLFEDKVNEIEHPNFREFDVRNKNDIMVEIFGSSYFISNHDIAWDLLAKEDINPSKVYASLGSPELFVVFCRYDTGGSYGYGFFENGKRTRSRLQTVGSEQLKPMLEFGAPKEIEQSWLNADSYLEEDDCPEEERQRIFINALNRNEVSEYFLTNQILQDILVSNFELCPWEAEVKPEYHFYKIQERKVWWKSIFS